MQIQLEPREQTSNVFRVLAPFFTIVLAIIIGAIPLLWMKINPFSAYKSILVGSCGDIYGISETLVKAIPLMLCGLAVAFPLTANNWNIGAEGQFLMGGFGASVVACGVM